MTTNASGVCKTPTEVANLATAFLNDCGSDSILMERVFRTALAILGLAPSGAAQSQVSPSSEGAQHKAGKESAKDSKTNDKLTPEEVKQAKKDFREKMGLQSLTPEQAKMAKQIFRQAKAGKKTSNNNNKSKLVVELDANLKPKSKVKSAKGPEKSGISQERKPRVSEATPYCSDGTRKTWNVKLRSHHSKAIERGVMFTDVEPEGPKSSAYGFALTDYFNSLITLKDTWLRFQNSWDSSGKKDPLKDLPALPDNAEAIIELWFKTEGAEPRKRESGQYILMDEQTSRSLRPKN